MLKVMCLGASTETEEKKNMTRKVKKELGRRSGQTPELGLTPHYVLAMAGTGQAGRTGTWASAASWRANDLLHRGLLASSKRKREQDRRTALFARALTQAFAG